MTITMNRKNEINTITGKNEHYFISIRNNTQIIDMYCIRIKCDTILKCREIL